MTQPTKRSTTGEEIIERGKDLVKQGNERRIVIRRENDEPLVDVSLTVAVAVAAVFFLFVPGSFFWAAVLAIGAIATKMRVEVLREIGDGSVIEMKKKNDEDE
ncbi:DUF4342 domain-containing protein [Phototrophicus methaneseepsis]|uniref:DUF4342 domain-containing protein n=1 Tax=Phototrophicus methaneseepsis TaxID=2710758 RepID=A0A7S8E9D1_9CHLR|nr:DUF4342 domain-containing protein [Phototrophicus methaneseepsis]QPC82779.1 DUF4342 domain-containing protein [Phototrophicus methaneseepsis]